MKNVRAPYPYIYITAISQERLIPGTERAVRGRRRRRGCVKVTGDA